MTNYVTRHAPIPSGFGHYGLTPAILLGAVQRILDADSIGAGSLLDECPLAFAAAAASAPHTYPFFGSYVYESWDEWHMSNPGADIHTKRLVAIRTLLAPFVKKLEDVPKRGMAPYQPTLSGLLTAIHAITEHTGEFGAGMFGNCPLSFMSRAHGRDWFTPMIGKDAHYDLPSAEWYAQRPVALQWDTEFEGEDETPKAARPEDGQSFVRKQLLAIRLLATHFAYLADGEE